MKIVLLVLGVLISFHGNVIDEQRSTPGFSSAYTIHQPKNYQGHFLPLFSYTAYVQKSEENVHFNYKTLSELLVTLLICVALLVVMLTPLVLVFFWVHYSVQYVKKYQDIFGIKKWLAGKSELNLESYSKEVWQKYRKDYSKMIGFGLSFLAYAVSSNIYMFRNFDRIDTALSEYFGFPFEVLNNMGWLGTVKEYDGTLLAVWKEMLLIVGVSVSVFFIGYVIGSMIVLWRYTSLQKGTKTPLK
jgi:hypothetical protein